MKGYENNVEWAFFSLKAQAFETIWIDRIKQNLNSDSESTQISSQTGGNLLHLGIPCAIQLGWPLGGSFLASVTHGGLC